MATQQNDNMLFFREAKPASIRIWHWLIFIFFTSTVITVVLGSTLFKTRNNIAMVQEQVQQKGGTITEKQAWSVAHEYSDKLWMLHKYIGYGLSLLLLWRIIIEVMLSKEKKISSRLRNAAQIPGSSPEKRHFLTVQYSYLIFYTLFIVMSMTGLVLAFEDVSWLKPVHEAAEETHKVVQYGLYTYMIFHIVGVIRSDLTKYNGIVSRMINGKN